ncbi:MAG: nuclease, partial [Bacteroidota bacterium]
MKKLLCITLFLMAPLVYCQEGKVIKVKDGDTVVILDKNNTQHTIRVADVDCPERGQPFSNVAKWFVSDEVFGKVVVVKKK